MLIDSGNRTNLAGTEAERDINIYNGRCDLLPASVIADYIVSEIVPKMHREEKDTKRIEAMRLLMEFIDKGMEDYLTSALSILMDYNYDTENTSADKSQILCKSMIDLSIHYKNGAEKYAERNWEKGLPVHSFIDSAIRHLCKDIIGMTDEPHLIACMWNICGALWTLEKYPELNDMPDYSKENKNVEEKVETNTEKEIGKEE